jgi:hypothetical protein
MAVASNEQHHRSDHRPVLVDTEYYDANLVRHHGGGKKFKAHWLAEETVNKIVKTAWEKAKMRGITPSLATRTNAVHLS